MAGSSRTTRKRGKNRDFVQGLAANEGDIAGVDQHLHHRLKCLVGVDGEGSDGSAGNPCGEAGGAIPQTDSADMLGTLE